MWIAFYSFTRLVMGFVQPDILCTPYPDDSNWPLHIICMSKQAAANHETCVYYSDDSLFSQAKTHCSTFSNKIVHI